MKKISETLRRTVMAPPGDRRIRVFSIQPFKLWRAAQERGVITPGGDWAAVDHGGEPEWMSDHDKPSHDWMRQKVAEKVADHSGDYPIDVFFKRPNERQHRFLETPHVLITADVPLSRMVILDYNLLIYVLNYWYVAKTEVEDDALEASGLQRHNGPKGMTPEMVASWEYLFDLRRRTDPAEISWIGQCDEFMGLVDGIRLDEVVQARLFTGRTGQRRTKFVHPPEAASDAAQAEVAQA